jgi:hypothetical protein
VAIVKANTVPNFLKTNTKIEGFVFDFALVKTSFILVKKAIIKFSIK